MSEEWLEYLKENNPELYAQAVASVEHSVRWRDRHIKGLESECGKLRAQLEAVRGLPEAWRNDTGKAEFGLSKEDCADELEQALSTNKTAG